MWFKSLDWFRYCRAVNWNQFVPLISIWYMWYFCGTLNFTLSILFLAVNRKKNNGNCNMWAGCLKDLAFVRYITGANKYDPAVWHCTPRSYIFQLLLKSNLSHYANCHLPNVSRNTESILQKNSPISFSS